MSEIAGAVPTPTGAAAPQIPNRSAATAIAHESYAFACMRCGHGWEQSYEIEHHIDGDGGEFVMYVVGGERVPSPLTRPTCLNCGGHVVRIMRAGRVSSVLGVMNREETEPERRRETGAEAGEHPAKDHHWHLSDLLHPFQNRKID
ncbi:hypothetical protein ACFRAO_15030 [Streptomyces sp. NPDC056656]|uniref:hypothetical protein n=1 Tax=Streptomyces sp. NPDC056656 TaxID=3345895 RepID=UPI00368F4725